MQLMDYSLDRFYKFIYEELNECIPEAFIGKVRKKHVDGERYLFINVCI